MDDQLHGMDVLMMLTFIFFLLKVFGVVNWSWVWVFSPVWIMLVLMIIVFAVILIKHYIGRDK